MTDFFKGIAQVQYEGPDSDNEFAFKHYNPDEEVLGKPMKEQLRFAAAWWHSFAWPGGDPFGGQTFKRPWFGDGMDKAKLKADVAFEMFDILQMPFFCWHDADIRPEGRSWFETRDNLHAMIDYIGAKMESSKARCLWGTANLFTHRRFMAGAATNPDPDVFAWAAATVKECIDGTHKLGGENYVLWGGREGYETLLNTDLKRERTQAGQFLRKVVDYKHKIGFKGTILIEPKPQEPSKHQYDYDVGTIYGFLKDFELEGEVKLNIETGHAFLAGHSFEHELAMAASLNLLGSIDMNRNDLQSGWDTDQFPNSAADCMLAYYEILKAGGFTTGGTNFDAKIRRQSLDPEDLILGHVGAMDICALGLKAAAKMLEDGKLEALRAERYAKWETPGNKAMLFQSSLEGICAQVESRGQDPEPKSGRQERLENLVNSYL